MSGVRLLEGAFVLLGYPTLVFALSCGSGIDQGVCLCELSLLRRVCRVIHVSCCGYAANLIFVYALIILHTSPGLLFR